MSEMPSKATKLGQHRLGMIVDEKGLAKCLRAAKANSTSSQMITAAKPTSPFLRSVENQIPINSYLMMCKFYPPLIGLAALLAGARGHASTLYGVEYNGQTDLFSLNQGTGAVSSIGASGQDNIADLTSDTRLGSQHVWGIRIPSKELFEFNPATGAATSVATLNSPDSMVSIAFNPVDGKLYGNTSFGFGAPFDSLYQIDPTTGNTTLVGRITFNNVFALGFDQSGTLFGVSDIANQLISISTITGNGSLVANLTLDLSFDLASRPEDNVMFLADTVTQDLYTLDTGTGATTLVGPYGANHNIVGLAFSQVPEMSQGWAVAGLMGLVVSLVGRRSPRITQL